MKFNITITEALAEIKTIGKRRETKQKQLMEYLVRDSKMLDPMAESGGSKEFVRRERQGIRDLNKRLIDLRAAIQASNMVTMLTLNDQEMTVFDWLTWRREVAPNVTDETSVMWRTIQAVRKPRERGIGIPGRSMLSAHAEVHSGDGEREFVVNVDEAELAKEREDIERIVGELDGRLSLLNATTTI